MVTEPEIVNFSEELGAPIASVAEFEAVAKLSTFAPWASETAMIPLFHVGGNG